MIFLRQSTAATVRIGSFVDATDGVTPETGVTLGAADQAEILKSGGGATVDISGATWAAITGCDGWYDLSLTTSHTDTVGGLRVIVQDSSVCLPVEKEFYVLEEAVYDLYFAASATGSKLTGDAYSYLTTNLGSAGASLSNISANVTQVSGDTTAADNLELFFDGTGYTATNSIVGQVVTVQDPVNTTITAAAIADAVWDEANAGHVSAGSTGKALADILVDTAEIGTAGAGLTAITSAVQVTVYPLSLTTTSRVSGATLKADVGATCTFTVTAYDNTGAAVDPSGLTLQVTIEDGDGTTLETIADGSITKTTTTFEFSTSTANAAVMNDGKWACIRTDTSESIGDGPYVVRHVAGN